MVYSSLFVSTVGIERSKCLLLSTKKKVPKSLNIAYLDSNQSQKDETIKI